MRTNQIASTSFVISFVLKEVGDLFLRGRTSFSHSTSTLPYFSTMDRQRLAIAASVYGA